MSEPLNLQSRDSSKNTEIATGIVALIFYFSAFAIPYGVSVKKNKIGISKFNGNKNFLISTALENSEEWHQWVTVAFYSFIIAGFYFLAYKGFFINNNDSRVGVPVAMYLFGAFIILLLWYNPKRGVKIHEALALLLIISGQTIVTLLYVSYQEFYSEDERFKALEIVFIILWCLFFLLVVFAIVMTQVKIKNMCWVVNIVSSLEIIHMIMIGIAMMIFIALPPLPSRCLFPRDPQEVAEITKNT